MINGSEKQLAQSGADPSTAAKQPASAKDSPGPVLCDTVRPINDGDDQVSLGTAIQEPRSVGEYRVLRRLGEGGMGAVYLGYHEQEKRQVAIKVLNGQHASIQASVDRFYREAKSGTLLDHPNIVRNLGVGQDDATRLHYLVMEYVDGPSGNALLDRFGHLTVGDAVHIVLDVARALEHAQSRNIIHRDIKPDNILLTTSGLAKLADLGLAKRTDETSHLTRARQGFGTPFYMPYEQAISAKSVDGRSDIYALGATLYHFLTGEVPFPGKNPLEIVDKKNLGAYAPASELNPSIPAELDRILGKMLAREPRDRYQTASELIVDLDRSKLAAPVLSFVDPDLALQDPLIRARLTTPAQPTCPDLQLAQKKERNSADQSNPEFWYLRYRDRAERWCKTKGTTKQIVQRLKDGRLPVEVEVCHQAQGKFLPLASVPEFQEAALQARRAKGVTPPVGLNGAGSAIPIRNEIEGAAKKRSWWTRFWLAGLALGLAVSGAVYYICRFS